MAENSSREYTAEKVKAQIERQKEMYGWGVYLPLTSMRFRPPGCMELFLTEQLTILLIAKYRTDFKVMASAVTTFRQSGI